MVVSEDTAMKLAAVWVCVTLISGDVAKLPWFVYQAMPDGSRRRAYEHPLYDILHTSPNTLMSAFNFKESALPHCLLHGNHYSLIERNKYTGDILGLWPIEAPYGVEVKRDGRLITYRWKDDKGRDQVGTQDTVFHVPGFGFDGVKGLSCISYAKSSIAVGIASDRFIQRFFGKGTHPSAVVTFPDEGSGMDPDTAEAYTLKLQEKVGGLGKSHNVMVLHNGEKIDRFTMSLADAQFLDNRRMTTSDVCAFYHVPPDRAGVYQKNANYNQSESDNQRYVDNCLTHWTTRFEQVANLRLLTKEDRQNGYFTEFLLNSLVKGNIKDRFEAYKSLWSMGLPLNTILVKENENPVEGGDVGYVPLNTVPADMVADVVKAKIDGAFKDNPNPEGKQ